MKGSNEMDGNLIYTNKISELGEDIFNISTKYLNANSDEYNAENLNNRYDNYLNTIKEYKECKISLNNIAPPSKVRVEHKKMVNAIQLFIDATGAMFNSNNIDNRSVGMASRNKGILMHKLGKITVLNLSGEIAAKLG